MKMLMGGKVVLKDEELLAKEMYNRNYLMELKSPALLQNYYNEAGLNQNFGSKEMAHGGWEDPTCQLRGHFLGHYLSAIAVRYYETKDEELLAKGNAIVHELRLCQIENGGLWAASIPEKYLHWISRGKQVWAPHYTVHKTFMGLNDMYRYAGNKEALEISVNFSKWFYDYTKDKTREEMDDILDVETGGMLEIWADLYEFTKDKMYLELIEKYDRHRLFDPLLEGEDVLSNMHANTTIPEAIGCAKIYEVTGIQRYKDIAMAYWKCAVDRRGYSVTGGQTCGEIWTPAFSLYNRLGSKNQEHCSVYNMIRLADYMFRWTKKKEYLDYIEQNMYNGILSQGYYKGTHANGEEKNELTEGLITYFQPLKAGSRKAWASKFNDFFCCHGSLVQANSAHNRYLYYQDENEIYVADYAESDVIFTVDKKDVTILQRRDTLSGSIQAAGDTAASHGIVENTHIYLHQPDVRLCVFNVKCETPVEFVLNLRIPKWVHSDVKLFINGKEETIGQYLKDGFLRIERKWSNEELRLWLPMDVYTTPIPDDEKIAGDTAASNNSGDGTGTGMVAYSFGPYALAGLCDEERILHLKGHKENELLVHDNEREWGSWKDTFRTRYQEFGINFIPLKDVGYERYQVYFPVED